MSSAFRFKSSLPTLSAPQIAALRRISPHSVAEIQRKAASDESLLDIPVFTGEWPAGKARVVALLAQIEQGALPLSVHLAQGDGQHAEGEALTIGQARQQLQFFRAIALEQDMQAQLEAGHIAAPEEYEPLPEDQA
jgi:hypothetical protein